MVFTEEILMGLNTEYSFIRLMPGSSFQEMTDLEYYRETFQVIYYIPDFRCWSAPQQFNFFDRSNQNKSLFINFINEDWSPKEDTLYGNLGVFIVSWMIDIIKKSNDYRLHMLLNGSINLRNGTKKRYEEYKEKSGHVWDIINQTWLEIFER